MQQYVDIVTLYMCMGAEITRAPYYNLASICYSVILRESLVKIEIYSILTSSNSGLLMTGSGSIGVLIA